MKATSFADMRCSIARTLEHVGSWWSLLIIRDAMMGVRRFGHFQKSLGIAKATLTARLTELVEGDILQKVPARDGSAHEEYQLTDKGRDLAPVMMAMAQWGDTWAEHPNGRSFAFVHGDTGREIARLLPRLEDGSEIPFTEIRLKAAQEEISR